MHSWISRGNSIIGFLSMVVPVLIALNMASTFFLPLDVPATLRFNELGKLKSVNTRSGRVDQATFTFDLEADFSSLFHWNTKQVFVMVTALYKTSTHQLNEVVVWDRIIERGDDKTLSLKGEKTKYPLTDFSTGLRDNASFKLQLSYEVTPVAGLISMRDVEGASDTFALQGYNA